MTWLDEEAEEKYTFSEDALPELQGMELRCLSK
jgi:hypothetical protein